MKKICTVRDRLADKSLIGFDALRKPPAAMAGGPEQPKAAPRAMVGE